MRGRKKIATPPPVLCSVLLFHIRIIIQKVEGHNIFHNLVCALSEAKGMKKYMNHFDIWRKRGVIFEQKYIERNNEIVKKYICKTKGIPLQRKIKVIIKQSLKRLNQKNGIRE